MNGKQIPRDEKFKREDIPQQLERYFREKYRNKLRTLENIDGATIVSIAKDIGGRLGNKKFVPEDGFEQLPEFKQEKGIDLKINQIRRFLDSMRRIEKEIEYMQLNKTEEGWDQIKNKLILLKPKLAYAAGRKSDVKPLMSVLEPAIDSASKNPEQLFSKLLAFMESIVAYHCYYGGKN